MFIININHALQYFYDIKLLIVFNRKPFNIVFVILIFQEGFLFILKEIALILFQCVDHSMLKQFLWNVLLNILDVIVSKIHGRRLRLRTYLSSINQIGLLNVRSF